MDGLPPPPLTQITQYPPANETAADLWNEESGLDGIMLSAVAYGVHATLFFLCSKFLWLDRKRRPHASALWMLYIAAHFVCGTIAVGADMKWAVMIWIKDRGYPGGPIAFTADYENFWIPFMGNVTSVISAWLQDWLLLYRFFVIFGSDFRWVLIPGAAYLVTAVLGSMLLVTLHEPGGNFTQSLTFDLFTTYWSLEVAVNLLLTTLIVGKLLYMRHRLRSIGQVDVHQSPYVSLSAMLVESSALFTAFGLAFLISYVRNDNFDGIVLPMCAQVQSIAPLLIIMRVAQGRAISSQFITEGSTTGRKYQTSEPLRFNHNSNGVSSSGVSSAPFSSRTGIIASSTAELDSMELARIKPELSESAFSFDPVVRANLPGLEQHVDRDTVS